MIRGVALALALALTATHAAAQEPAKEPDLADLDIEELGRIRITSTARRPEPASRAAAAVYVITREDIRRAGAVSLPEALRLVPGLQAAAGHRPGLVRSPPGASPSSPPTSCWS